MLGPVITGSLVTLGPPRASDLELYCGWFRDPEITYYLTRDTPPSFKEEEEWFERTARSDRDVVWGLYVLDRVVGMIGIHAIDWRSRHGTTGTLIADREYWGKGIGTEAMQLRSRYAFDELGLEKLITHVFEGNAASRRALERAGYGTVGIQRRQEFRHGRWFDVWIGELLRDEWLAAQQRDRSTL